MTKQLSIETLYNKPRNKVALIIGQAPPEKNYQIPFSGTRLYHWFMTIGITKDEAITLFDFDALANNFLGKKNNKHIIPNEFEINQHIPSLIKKINEGDFKAIIPVGKLAIQYTLNIKPDLEKVIGREFYESTFNKKAKSTLVIPLPHPSGLSTWYFKEPNKSKLKDALEHIKKITLQNI